jgi:Mlc titration factor MtfA (ptsG expression regulator)
MGSPFDWLRDWKRARTLRKHSIEAALWRAAAGKLPFIQVLSQEERKSLEDLVILFLAEKEFAGAHGLEVTDAMRVAIAAQACLLILKLDLEWYAGWTGVVVHAGDFRVRRSELDEAGVLHEWDDELAGESMPGGPVVISWDAAAHDVSMNVVIHEFAHKLDMLNGVADGVPPLHAGMDARAWKAAFQEAYEGFCDALERGRDTWLDPYAAEHPSEFFAVVSEAFFEDPRETQRRYPDVYGQLRLFYRQDPAARL